MIIRIDPLDGTRTVQFGFAPAAYGVTEYREWSYWMLDELVKRALVDVRREMAVKVWIMRLSGWRIKKRSRYNDGVRVVFWQSTKYATQALSRQIRE